MLNRHKNWLVHKQTACGKDFSNPFMVDNLPKIVGFSTHLASLVKSWLVQDQTVLGCRGLFSLGLTTNVFDVESLAKLMANEYAMANDQYNIQKGREMSKLLRIKKEELELKAVELEIRRLKNCQRDEALYFSTTDEDLKAILKARLFG
ncbi:hypothetical protein Tco_0635084 [Tanacetum coccineum]